MDEEKGFVHAGMVAGRACVYGGGMVGVWWRYGGGSRLCAGEQGGTVGWLGLGSFKANDKTWARARFRVVTKQGVGSVMHCTCD